MPTPAYLVTPHEAAPVEHLKDIQLLLELAREQRREKNYDNAAAMLVSIMETNAPAEIKRPALFELALIAQDQGKYVKAQQIFAQYLQKYPDDPSMPEVLLRQGLVYRQMGVDSLAISKFYAVMSSSLKLRLENMDYYKKLVLQAQVEIADTHYLDGAFADASDYYSRILKNGSPELNTALIQYKLVRSLSFQTNNAETAAKAQTFLDSYPNSADVPEIRFVLASCLKKMGRNQESMRQVLILLQSQQQKSSKNPESWIYWQQRAGNEIANQLYKEGDYMSSLQIYLSLADLSKSPDWQLPVWYQTALVYEQLMQPQKASEVYSNILARKKEFADAPASPGMDSLFEMARWRKDYLDWLAKAKTASQDIKPGLVNPLTNSPAAPTNVLTSSTTP
jgi:tetratricopeptide (TPR) repeat protein